MSVRRLRAVVFYLVLAAGGLVVGILAGGGYSKWRAEAATAKESAQLQTFLEQSLHGIGVGQPFPDVPIWSVDGQKAYLVPELLPEGGLILFVSGVCPSCYTSMNALKSAADDLGSRVLPAIIICNDAPSDLAQYTRDHGIHIAVYHDREQRLSRMYGVVTLPTYIRLGADQRITAIGAEARTVDQLKELLSHD
jgi:peroxiredoxin